MNSHCLRLSALPFIITAAVWTLTACATSATAATVALMDFGRGDNTSSAAYNNITFGSNGNNVTTGTVALTDPSTAATGWSINVTENGNQNGGDAGSGADVGTAPAAILPFEQTAWEDNMFANGTASSLAVSITGLDDSLTYDLLFYGSRANGQSSTQTWSLTEGSGGANVVHPSGLNSTVIVDWTGLSTNGSGEIAFTVTGGTAIALNFGRITEEMVAAPAPEPSSTVLFGLAIVGLVIRRRRR